MEKPSLLARRRWSFEPLSLAMDSILIDRDEGKEMRRVFPALLALGILASVVGLAANYLSAVPSGPPRVWVDRDEHNWGRVDPNQEVRTSFTIKNVGGSSLDLGTPKASCGCTKPILSAHRLLPGGQSVLSVGFVAPAEPRSVSHSVSLSTSDPTLPELRFTLFAESWTGIRTSLQTLDFGTLGPGEEAEETVEVFSPDHEKFKILQLLSDIDGLKASSDTSGSALAVHRVEVRYRASDRLGDIRGRVIIATDHPKGHMVTLDAQSKIVGPVEAIPSSARIDKSDIGKVVQRKFLLRVSGAQRDYELDKIEAMPPWEILGHTVKKLPNKDMVLDLSFRFPRGSGAEYGELRLSLRGPKPVSIVVPLSIHGWTPSRVVEEGNNTGLEH